MGLQGKAAVVGVAQYKPEKYATAPRMFHLEQVADLAGQALADAGLTLPDIDGLVVTGAHFHETNQFVPAMVGEYLGVPLNFAEVIDLGGASSVGAVWRAAAAIELGLCNAVLCVIPARMAPTSADDDHAAEIMKASRYGGHSTRWGAPEAEMDLPYGHMAQNTGYAMIAQRYAAMHGYDAAALARICVAQRFNACHNPDAMFYGQPITVDDVLASRMVAEPLRMLEIVMPVAGGAAVIVAREDIARRCKHRGVHVVGCGEHVQTKSPTYAADMLATPIGPASRKAFAMAGCTPADVHMAQIYDCYTITVLLSLEGAGFCAPGEGLRFLREHDFTFNGDFPMNTHGGQLSFGQTGSAGGMTQLIETVAQTCGHPLPGTEVRCVDAEGRTLERGEPGEVLLRGYHVMRGYFEDPAATAMAIDADGWLYTGDIGVLDERGYLRITDRLKDMFIVGGFNCYPAEIERTLAEHPAIAQVAVVGVPDSRMGEVGCACVVLRAGATLGEDELIGWSRMHMANYKVPRHLRLYDALPMNASNKVAKRELATEVRASLASLAGG